MNNNKQSSIIWFAVESWKLGMQLQNKEISIDKHSVLWVDLLVKAKAMHVQEHGNTWDASMRNLQERGMNEARAWEDFDEYYNETYGGNK